MTVVRERVFVDANELFPFAAMDLVLALAEDLLFDFVWSDELLDEWERVIVRHGRRSSESARAVGEAVRTFFGSGRIEPAGYRDLVAETPGPDGDDRVHTAACIAGRATVLLTRNRRDFPIEHLAAHDVRVMSADAFFTELLRSRPAAVVATVRRLAAEKRRPPRTPCELVAGLRAAGATHFSSRLGRRLDCPS